MVKINLQSLVKSKVFWSSIIIIILSVTSITFYILKEKERHLRIYTEKELARTVEEKKLVENNLKETVRVKEVVEKELIDEKERALALEKEVQDKEEEIKLTLDKLERETITRHQAEAQLILAIKENKTLEAKIEEIAAASKNVELEKIVIKSTPELAGKVLMVDKEHNFVVVDLGRGDNLKLGDILSIYRNDVFLGKAQVERLEEKNSAATILPDWQNVEFEVNDEVKGI